MISDLQHSVAPWEVYCVLNNDFGVKCIVLRQTGNVSSTWLIISFDVMMMCVQLRRRR